MPFPSTGCNTCRGRHIKCDEDRPVCGQCRKSGRHCTGLEDGSGSLLFRNENIYASNRSAKRPRGGARRSPDNESHQLRTSITWEEPKRRSSSMPGRKKSTPVSDEKKGMIKETLPTLPAILPLSIVWKAYESFTQEYVEVARRTSCQCHFWGFLNQKGFEWGPSAPDSALNLAATAVSLVFYGRKQDAPLAFQEAQTKYSKALVETRNEIMSSSATDQTLITVMMLSAYEDRRCHFDRETLSSEAFRHADGALSLLKIRQHKKGVSERSLQLDKHIRRQLIRQSLYRANPLPSWLQNGADFGELGVELDLDRGIVRTVQLRHRTLALFSSIRSLPPEERLAFSEDLQQAIQDGFDVDQSLRTWSLVLPPEYDYHIVDGDPMQGSEDSLFYHGSSHVYNELQYAVAWNRYRTARIVACGLVVKALEWSQSLAFPKGVQDGTTSTMSEVQLVLRKLVDDVCATVPYHFGLGSPEMVDKTAEDILAAISAVRLCALIWPLTVLSGTRDISDFARRWVKSKLSMIGRVTGSGIVEALANLDLHQDATLIQYSLEDHLDKQQLVDGRCSWT